MQALLKADLGNEQRSTGLVRYRAAPPPDRRRGNPRMEEENSAWPDVGRFYDGILILRSSVNKQLEYA